MLVGWNIGDAYVTLSIITAVSGCMAEFPAVLHQYQVYSFFVPF